MYSDAHRLFLQIISQRHVLLGPEVKSTFEKCCSRYNIEIENSDFQLRDFILEINEALRPLHLTIKKSIQEDYDGDTQCFVLVNMLSTDAAARFSSVLTSQELALFRRIIEEIVHSDDGYLLETDAINLATTLETRMRIGDSEALIERLVQSKWLLKHLQGRMRRLSLSALSTSSLEPYLEEVYEGDVTKCYLCKIITFKGISCPSCDMKVHRQCCRKYWAKQNSREPTCLECGEAWPEMPEVEQRKRRRTNV